MAKNNKRQYLFHMLVQKGMYVLTKRDEWRQRRVDNNHLHSYIHMYHYYHYHSSQCLNDRERFNRITRSYPRSPSIPVLSLQVISNFQTQTLHLLTLCICEVLCVAAWHYLSNVERLSPVVHCTVMRNEKPSFLIFKWTSHLSHLPFTQLATSQEGLQVGL